MSEVNRIVFECLDDALSSFDLDKRTFYDYLKVHYNFDFSKFSDNFQIVHEALNSVFAINHYKIERKIIKTLNERARDGTYDRDTEITAFGNIVNVFLKESEKNIKRTKSLASVSNYAKQLEERVKEANDKLKASERLAAIGETAAMVGHDIRNPLQAIVGELYLQKKELEKLLDVEVKNNIEESIKAIEENIFYINKIVSDLQDYAKSFIPDKTQVDINDVLSNVFGMVLIPEDIQVETQISKDFPKIIADQQMLKRALSNLVQNAVQAMPKGGKLVVSARCFQEKIELSVQDTGNGIPEEAKTRIFKPLFTTKSKGQGLGLAVVKRLIEAQEGSVRFESEPGKGAKFIISLPLK